MIKFRNPKTKELMEKYGYTNIRIKRKKEEKPKIKPRNFKKEIKHDFCEFRYNNGYKKVDDMYKPCNIELLFCFLSEEYLKGFTMKQISDALGKETKFIGEYLDFYWEILQWSRIQMNGKQKIPTNHQKMEI